MMSDSVVTFQKQLASILEALVRNAVCEITRLYESSFADLQSVLAQSEREKASLRARLEQAERRAPEAQKNDGHMETVVKEEDSEGDVKMDMFCAVCGKAAECEPPFCETCRKTVQFPSQTPESSSTLAMVLSKEDAPGGNSFDLPKSLYLNVTEGDTEEFPCLLESKNVSSLNEEPRAKSPVAPEAPAVPSVRRGRPSCGERLSSAKRARPSPEVDSTCDSMAVEAKELVQAVLSRRPGGERVLEEYRAKGTLTDTTRRHLINILVAHMTETQGTTPPKNVRELYALGIITLFPSLKDPFSEKGYEHFYDGQSGTGYLAWRLKTVQRKSVPRSRGLQKSSVSRGPDFERQTQLSAQLQGESCEQAVSDLADCTDREQVFLKMRETFHYRRQLVHDPQRNSTVLSTFPRLLDTKGLVNQDFTLLFGLETSCKLLETWDSCFKAKVIKEAKSLTQSADLYGLLKCAEYEPNEDEDPPGGLGWDSDMASVLLLVHLLPPPPGGRKAAKISVREALDRLVQFHKSNSRPELPPSMTNQRQPYLVAVGRRRDQIQSFYIALDGNLLPCQASCSLGAFDELFKTHFVFGLSYDEALSSVYTFLQTTVYHIDVGSVKESPRVKELRARLLNNC
ncbi:uncharacterized protein LOC108937987 [Scleropages formosus]|uniref:uncharacterized protein LOC108937987 n=1 Tax=Scleropages formosus TaxID=113540 RepID=UPI000878C3C1|nr:uncharacterized protein LOC108937987 [Scleropages formosus]